MLKSSVAAAAMAAAVCILSPTPGRAEPRRPALPESLLTESATDVDADEGGEVEYEANLSSARARAQRGASAAKEVAASLEVEWRIFQNVGVRAEPTYARVVEPAGASHAFFGFSGALAVGLLHRFENDLHMQLELLGRTAEPDEVHTYDPAGTQLPVAGDLVTAARFARWTVRATAGVEVGGSYAHAPLHTDVALLTGVLRDARFGFFGLEARADWARVAPLVLAPEVIADGTSFGLPLRLGLALPVNVGRRAEEPSYGFFLRLIVMSSREAHEAAEGRN